MSSNPALVGNIRCGVDGLFVILSSPGGPYDAGAVTLCSAGVPTRVKMNRGWGHPRYNRKSASCVRS